MTCNHTNLSLPVTVSLCLDTGDHDCCPDEFETMVVCKDCGYYKITSVQEVCADCCNKDATIWNDYLNTWHAPDGSEGWSGTNLGFNLTSYSVYQNALNSSDAISSCEFMVKGYHYTKPTSPSRTDSARLYIDMEVDPLPSDLNQSFIEAIPYSTDNGQRTYSYTTHNLIRDWEVIGFFLSAADSEPYMVYQREYSDRGQWRTNLDGEKVNLGQLIQDIPGISDFPQITSTNNEITISFNLTEGAWYNPSLISDYSIDYAQYLSILPETAYMDNDVPTLCHLKGFHNFYIKTDGKNQVEGKSQYCINTSDSSTYPYQIILNKTPLNGTKINITDSVEWDHSDGHSLVNTSTQFTAGTANTTQNTLTPILGSPINITFTYDGNKTITINGPTSCHTVTIVYKYI